jgi:hypothetical protein
MTRAVRRLATCLTIALAMSATPAAARAQDPDGRPDVAALTTALDATDLSARAVAVAALATVAPANLPSATRRKLVALLEREATSPRPVRTDDDGEDGEVGPYLTELVEAVVRLQEPTSARGLALLGIASNADAQQFVASRGDAAVALLDEAERADTNNRRAVAATRGRMLGDYPALLSPSSRLAVRGAVLRLAPVDPLAFAHAAEFGRLVETVPLLARIASSSTDEFDRSTLAGTIKELTALRAKATPESILDGLTESIAALCDGAQGSRFGACQSMTKTATNALDDLRAGRPAVHDLLHALGTIADDAQRRGAITPLEGAMISGTAVYLATRI